MAETTADSTTRWTTRALLDWMQRAFEAKGLDETRRSAEILLEHVLNCRRMDLYIAPDRPASPEELATLRDLVSRALNNEPVQYLIGEWSFFGLDLRVDQRALIPRPCTELIPEEVIQHARRTGRLGKVTHGQIKPLGADTPPPAEPEQSAAAPQSGDAPAEQAESPPPTPPAPPAPPADGSGILLADIGTGSGVIALALLRNIPGAKAFATDISPDALALATENAERLGLSARFKPLQGDLLQPLLDYPGVAKAADSGRGALDYLVSNPPYIPDAEWNDPAMMGANVKGHEPETALRGGADGLRFVRPLLEHAPRLLKPGGLLLIEIASSTAPVVLKIAEQHPLLTGATILNDLEGKPRTLRAQRQA
ncbi:MAG: N5-glutamine methyltransferase family protein [Phycisphaerales bacterium JB050]